MIESPCISKCKINEKKLCSGCYRTPGEIKAWRDLGDSMKRLILDRAELRKLND